MDPHTLGSILKKAAQGEVQEWADFCDQQKQTDDHIRATYETRIAAIAGARHVIESGKPDDPAANRAAELCDRTLRELRPDGNDWSSLGAHTLASHLLDGIGVGFGATELGWVKDGAGVETVQRAWWVHQRHFKWSDDWQILLIDTGFKQVSSGVPLEPDKFMVHVPRSVTGFPTVTGTLRATSWPYLFKRWGIQYWIDGAEQFAWPLIMSIVNPDTTETVRAQHLEALARWSPNNKLITEADNQIVVVESGVKDGQTWRGLVEYMDRAISKANLGMTDASEPSKVGAWKAVESRVGVTVNARQRMDERCLAETYETQLFDPITRLNFGPSVAVPRIRWMISAERQEPAPHLVAAGVFTVNELRSFMGMEPKAGGDVLPGLGAPQGAGAAPASTPEPPSAPAAAAAAQDAQEMPAPPPS